MALTSYRQEFLMKWRLPLHLGCFIFQQSYDTGTIPSDWSKGLVTAIHKKDARSNPANYRPISLTCVCCKLMEHIMLSHISKHLSINDIIINHQHGFRQKFSCETQLISTINDWTKSINRRTQTDLILPDFSKAFDSVPHQCLLSKLNFYGIRVRSLDWIKAFVIDHTQVVSINGTHSNPYPLSLECPRGQSWAQY